MSSNLKCPDLSGLNILIIVIITGIFIGSLPLLETKMNKAEADLVKREIEEMTNGFEGKLALLQGNSLLPSPPAPSDLGSFLSREVEVVVTAYSSSPWETDEDPYTTASGTRVREGIVAANFLPFGTKIKLPKIYGEKIFVVEDRMNSQKGYQIDIWFPEYNQALNFGVKITHIEILES